MKQFLKSREHLLIMLFFLAITFTSQYPNSEKSDLIFDVIEKSKGFIFNELRNIKSQFPSYTHPKLEKEIKEYEFRYLSNKTEFIDYLFSKFDEYEERKKLDDEDFRINDNDMQREIFFFLKKFLPFFMKIPKREQNLFLKSNITDKFTKDIIKFGLEYQFLFFNNEQDNTLNSSSQIENIIENLPNFLLKKNVSLDNLSSFSEYEPSNIKINQKFNNFLQNLTSKFNMSFLKNDNIPLYQKEEYVKINSEKLPPETMNQFSSFLEEYLHESVLDNDLFKQKYTLLQNNINFNDMSFKQNQPVDQITVDEEAVINMTQNMNENQEKLEASVESVNLIKQNNQLESEKEKMQDIIDLSGPCENKEKELDQIIEMKLKKLEEEQNKVEDELREVPEEFLTTSNEDSKSKFKKMLNIIEEFIKKVLKLAAKHFPFYFFKICIPAGPLTLGCCPEAGLVPQQLYGVFTSFDKVEAFKVAAKGYPDWLASIGHQDFGETQYYLCAQSYLTIQESSLFNICSPTSLIYLLPPNWFGLLPGDMPLCFWACLQGMVVCKTKIDSFGSCGSLISLQTIIMAAMIPSLRIRLIMIFGMCTYIPFLVRWDLVPKWIRPRSDEIIDGNNGNTFVKRKPPEVDVDKGNVLVKGCPDCAKMQEEQEDYEKIREVKSAFEEEYENLNPMAKDEIKKLKREKINFSKNEQKEEDEQKGEDSDNKGNKVNFANDLGRDRLIEDSFDYFYYYSIKPNDKKYEYIIEKRNLFNQSNWKYLMRRKFIGLTLFEKEVDLDYELKLGEKAASEEHYTEIYNIKQDDLQPKQLYQILTYSDNYSEEKRKNFPFQVREILIEPGKTEDISYYERMRNVVNQKVDNY